MRSFFFLILLLCSFCACHSDSSSSEAKPSSSPSSPADNTPLIYTINSTKNDSEDPFIKPELTLDEELMREDIASFQEKYGSQYEDIIYGLWIDTAHYFVVVNGDWSLESQKERGQGQKASPYQMGLVNTKNDVLIPVKFDKIYNMGATASNLFEVEWQGKHGLYDLHGVALLKEEYDAIYPANPSSDNWAYWRKGQMWGVLHKDGKIASLEKQPEDLVSSYAFDTKKAPIVPFIQCSSFSKESFDPDGRGLLIYPSYLYELAITPAYEKYWNYDKMSVEGLQAARVDVKQLPTSPPTLLTSFTKGFMGIRDYAYLQEEAIVSVNQQYQSIDNLTLEDFSTLPVCVTPIQVSLVGIDTIAVTQTIETPNKTYDYQTAKTYYHLKPNGKLDALPKQGRFAATQYTLLTAADLKGCFAHDLSEDSADEGKLTFEIRQHLSVEDLKYMRNEIYARHGYQFKNKKWKEIFEQESWYRGTLEDVEALLSPLEKHNAQFLLDYQKEMEKGEQEFLQVSYETIHEGI